MADKNTDNAINAIVDGADGLALALLEAFKAPTAHADTHPLILEGDGDMRSILLDGHFDFVAITRHLREKLR